MTEQNKRSAQQTQTKQPPQHVPVDTSKATAQQRVQRMIGEKAARVDVAQVLSELEMHDRTKTSDVQFRSCSFQAPEQQISRLENTTNQLQEINQRVSSLLSDYEASRQTEDEVFQVLADEESRDLHFDTRSVLQQSKGKVQVLIVDYGKLCMDRQEVLDSLKQWFTNAAQEHSLEDFEEMEEARPASATVRPILQNAMDSRFKLASLHQELIDFCQKQVKTAQNVAADVAFTAAERDQLIGEKQRLLEDLKATVNRLRDAEARTIALQKLLDKRTDELKLSHTKEGGETAGLKQELHDQMQRHREREMELLAENEELKKRLEKTKEKLDIAIVENIAKNAPNEKLKEAKATTSAAGPPSEGEGEREVSPEVAALENEKKELETKVTSLERQLKGQELSAQQELSAFKHQKEEELAVKLAKQKQQYESLLQRVREDSAAHFKEVEQQNKQIYEQQNARLATAVGTNNFQSILESVQANFNERLQQAKEAMAHEFSVEKEELKKDYMQREVDLRSEFAAKMSASQAAWQRQLKHSTSSENLSSPTSALSTARDKTLRDEQTHLISKLTQESDELNRQIETLKLEMMKKDKAIQALQEKFDVASVELTSLRYESAKVQASARSKSTEVIELQEALKNAQEKEKHAQEALQTRPQQAPQPAQGSQEQQMFTRQELDLQLSALRKELEQERNKEVARIRSTMYSTGQREREEVSKKAQDALESERQLWQEKIEYLVAQVKEREKTKETASESQNVTTTATTSTTDLVTQRISQLQEHLQQQQELKAQAMLGLSGVSSSEVDSSKIVEIDSNIEFINQELTAELKRKSKRYLGEADSSKTEYMEAVVTEVPALLSRLKDMESLVTRLTRQNYEQENQIFELRENLIAFSRPQDSQNPSTSSSSQPITASTFTSTSTLIQPTPSEVIKMQAEIRKLREQIAELSEKSKSASTAEASLNIVESEARLGRLEEALKSEAQLKAQVTFLEKSLASKEEVLTAMQQREIDLKKLIEDLEAKLALKISMSPDGQALASAQRDARNFLDQLNALTKAVDAEREVAQKTMDQMRKDADSEKKQILSKHESFVKDLTENYERRISGLTQALTASLEDHELVAELMKENDAKLQSAEIMHRNNIDKVKQEMKQLEEEHNESMRQLSEEDTTQVQQMKQLLAKLHGDCLDLMDEEARQQERANCVQAPEEGKPTEQQEQPKPKPEQQQQKAQATLTVVLEPPSEQPIQPKQLPARKPLTILPQPQRKTMGKEMQELEEIYQTMTSVVRGNQGRMSDEQSSRIIALQKDMVKAREIIATQQKTLSELQSHAAKSEYDISAEMADQQAKLQDQAALIISLKQRYSVQRDRLLEFKEEKTKLLGNIEQLEVSVRQKEVMVEDLRQQLNVLRKQLEVAESQGRFNAGRTAFRQMRHSSATPTNAPGRPLVADTLTRLVQSGANVSSNKLKQLEEAVYGFDEGILDDEGRKKRQFALEMFERDRELRQQRVFVTFQKLREKLEHKKLEEQMASSIPDDKLSRVLRRMAERHDLALREWDRRKQQIIDARRRQIIMVMQAFSDFAVYKPVPTGATVSAARAKFIVIGEPNSEPTSTRGTTSLLQQQQQNLNQQQQQYQNQVVHFGRDRVFPPKTQQRFAPLLGREGEASTFVSGSSISGNADTALALYGTSVLTSDQQQQQSGATNSNARGFGQRPPPVISSEQQQTTATQEPNGLEGNELTITGLIPPIKLPQPRPPQQQQQQQPPKEDVVVLPPIASRPPTQ